MRAAACTSERPRYFVPARRPAKPVHAVRRTGPLGPNFNYVAPYVLRGGDVVQVVVANPQTYPHPMHLHGHRFQVLACGRGAWDGNAQTLPPAPVQRDVVAVPPRGYAVLRFRADNPGVWSFHCHIDVHLAAGMAVTLVEDPAALQRAQPFPAAAAAAAAAERLCLAQPGAVRGSVGSARGDCAGRAVDGLQNASDCNTIWNTDPRPWGALVAPPS